MRRSFSAHNQLIVHRMSKYVRSLRTVLSRDRGNERASQRKASLRADRSRNPFLMNRKVYVLSRNEIMRAVERGFRFMGERTFADFLFILYIHGIRSYGRFCDIIEKGKIFHVKMDRKCKTKYFSKT